MTTTITQLSKPEQLLAQFAEGITAFEGRKGSGKTTAAVAIMHKLRETFNIPSVCDFPLKEAYGDYTKISIPTFVDELRLITEATQGMGKEVAERATDVLFKKRYPSIVGSTMLLDEAYKYVDSRMPNDKVVRLFGYWISQIRHYQTSLLLIVPHMDMVDKRVARQVDRVARCYTDERTGRVKVMVTDFQKSKPTRITINATRYWEMFDSWVLLPFRSNALNVGTEGELTDGDLELDE